MKRVLALMCLLAVLVPSVAMANVFQTFFPASGQLLAEIATSSSVDGVHHIFLGIDVATWICIRSRWRQAVRPTPPPDALGSTASSRV